MFQECCEKVRVEYNNGTADDVYEKYPELFATYDLMEDKVTYMSQDEKHVIALCGGKWMIQRAKYRLL